MPELALATIAFNTPWVIAEQIRLLHKHLLDDFTLTVFDNSSDRAAAAEIRGACAATGTEWVGCGIDDHDHSKALNLAAHELYDRRDAPYIGFLDHDVFPACPTRVVPLVEECGFYGVGQRHAPTSSLYLWPGFCFFRRSWLAGRPLDFGGIRGAVKRDDGDTGSMLAPLFADEDWSKLYRMEHGYHALREPDDAGLQSWGFERLSDWRHLTNASGWKAIPKPGERERLARAIVAAL